MGNREIDVAALKAAVNAVLDHLIEDLGARTVRIDDDEDLYWRPRISELSDMSKEPTNSAIGRLSDDVDFVRLMRRGQGGDVAYNLVHIAPLLRYIGEKVKR
jgi:hypothetical protein